MLRVADFAGAIFDVDDTLLDNKERDPAGSLHQRSRLAAIHAVGKRRGLSGLQTLTAEENYTTFHTAKTHSLEGAIWNMLHIKGVVSTDVVDFEHEILREIADLKNELHEVILRTEGEEVPGASTFVRTLAEHGLKGKMAIASTAVRRDIDIFLEMYGLPELFPPARIIDKHQVMHMKPHPEVFEKAFKTLGLPVGQKRKVVVFEDDPRGIAAAKAAGLCVFAITAVHDREKLAALPEPPDVIADSYAEFAELIGLPLEP
jgi:beta-phosphoglucomutase-like phosphatase (HAD superfamily)